MDHELEIAVAAARNAGQFTLKYFDKPTTRVEIKSDLSPVTEADKGAEQIIREALVKAFPNDSLLGEEWGHEVKDAGRCWIIDPIDGTRSFIRGVAQYGVMIGLEVDGRMELGVIYFPALDELYTGVRGGEATRDGSQISCSEIDSLSDSLYLFTDPRYLQERGEHPVENWMDDAGLLRTWGDCYGHMLVASGRAEIMVDSIMSPWDCAAVIPIVTAAGGKCFDFQGKEKIDGQGLISCNTALGSELLDQIKPA